VLAVNKRYGLIFKRAERLETDDKKLISQDVRDSNKENTSIIAGDIEKIKEINDPK
jgi:uncharacterized DUF497 family protein